VQTVTGENVICVLIGCVSTPQPDTSSVLIDTGDASANALNTALVSAVSKSVNKCSPSHTPPRWMRKQVLHMSLTLGVGNTHQFMSWWVNTQLHEQRSDSGHQPFAAGFIAIRNSRLDDHGGEAGLVGKHCCGQTHGSTSHNNYSLATHVKRSNARFSVGMRKPNNNTAFNTVNATAVIHALWTRGRAIPSTATIQ
jgi:hypothetical protein